MCKLKHARITSHVDWLVAPAAKTVADVRHSLYLNLPLGHFCWKPFEITRLLSLATIIDVGGSAHHKGS